MKDIADRIKELIEHLQLSNKSFAESIDIAPAIISHVLSGRNNPSLHLIQQITNVYTNVNLTYLLNGDGSLLIDESDKQGVRAESSKSKVGQQSSPLPPGARYVSPPSGAPVSPKHDNASGHTSIPKETPKQENRPPADPKPELTDNERSDKQENDSFTNVYQASGKRIERIVVFYTDRSFREYLPEA